MEKQNVTLSIPKEILRAAKHLAVDRGISLSGLLVEALEERVNAFRKCAGLPRERTLMRRGFKFGTADKIRWSREDLHTR